MKWYRSIIFFNTTDKSVINFIGKYVLILFSKTEKNPPHTKRKANHFNARRAVETHKSRYQKWSLHQFKYKKDTKEHFFTCIIENANVFIHNFWTFCHLITSYGLTRYMEVKIMPKVRLEVATPRLQTQCYSHWAIQLKSYLLVESWVYPVVYCIIIYLSFLNCDWLLIREVQWFYWTQKLLLPVEKFKVRMPKVRLELATPGLQIQCSSHWAIQLESYCWEGVEFIQLVYSIIIYLSFLNCDWLPIREVQWFH